MRILVIEHSHVGHRFPYLRMLLPALRELSSSVTLAIPRDSVGTDEYRSQLASLEDRIEIDAWLPTHKRWSTWYKPAEVRESIRRARAEYVYIPHADGYAQIAGLFRCLRLPVLPAAVEVEALVMRGTFAYEQSGVLAAIKAAVSMELVLRGPWSRLHLLDPLVYQRIKTRRGRVPDGARLLPDPVPPAQDVSREAARRRLGIPEDGRYIVSAGVLDARKGTDLLVNAFRQADLPGRDRLLLAGRLAPEIHDLLDRTCGDLLADERIILMDRFISDEEFGLAIAAADVVCTPYRQHIGSASIAVRAAAAGRFVLASDYGWLGRIVPMFGLGRTCETGSPDVFSAELVAALDAAQHHVLHEAARRFVAFNTREIFIAAWTDRLRERLGQARDGHGMTWEMVVGSGGEAP